MLRFIFTFAHFCLIKHITASNILLLSSTSFHVSVLGRATRYFRGFVFFFCYVGNDVMSYLITCRNGHVGLCGDKLLISNENNTYNGQIMQRHPSERTCFYRNFRHFRFYIF